MVDRLRTLHYIIADVIRNCSSASQLKSRAMIQGVLRSVLTQNASSGSRAYIRTAAASRQVIVQPCSQSSRSRKAQIQPFRALRSSIVAMATESQAPVKSEQAGLLEGRRVLITGASRGIGAAIAAAFAEQGAKVIVTAEEGQMEGLETVAQNCRSKGSPEVDVIPADLADTKNADALANKLVDKYGGVDVLVNNAGAFGPMDLQKGDNKGQGPLDGDPSEWDRLVTINMLSPMHLTRGLAPAMVQKGAGHIITIASIEALSPYPTAPAYSSSKWGLRGWNKACYAALKTEGVKCFTVNPAQVDTSMTRDRPDQEMIPSLEIEPEDIAEACLLPFRMSGNVVLEEIIVHTAKTPKKPKE